MKQKLQNDDLVKENAALHHKVDQLTRENNTLQTSNAELSKVKSKVSESCLYLKCGNNIL